MHGVVAQLTSTVRRLASNDSIPQDEQIRLSDALQTIVAEYGSKATSSLESLSFESVMHVPFDDQDYSYLDALFPEEDFSFAGPSNPLGWASTLSEEQDGDKLLIPHASAALYTFFASQVNTGGPVLSLKRDIML